MCLIGGILFWDAIEYSCGLLTIEVAPFKLAKLNHICTYKFSLKFLSI